MIYTHDDPTSCMRRHDEAAAIFHERVEGIRDEYVEAFERGAFNTFIPTFKGTDRLVTVISEHLCDTPGNPLHEILALLAKVARTNQEAADLIKRMAYEHARSVAEAE
jgi:hypothetical protein